MTTSPLTDAYAAAAVLVPQILCEAVLASGPGVSRADAHRRLRHACELARELATRLEAAEILFAATPLEEPPAADGAAWTGRDTKAEQS